MSAPPPQYSYVSSHVPSVVRTTFVMPGRPPPISVLPPSMFWVSPATSTTSPLHFALRPFQVRWARICPCESVAVSLAVSRVATPVVGSKPV